MRRAACLAFVSALFFQGCAHSPRIPDAYGVGPDQLRAALQQLIPVGTPAEVAVEILKRDGFKCEVYSNEPIPHLGLDGPLFEQTGDFINAKRSILPWAFASQDTCWWAILVLQDGKVASYRTYYSH